MKINEVKISGFRIYKNPEDATFNFEQNGKTSNFISIYAPNGFGKTSFYDAVEWCMTNSIERFTINKGTKQLTDESIKVIKQNSIDNHISIIRNRNVADNIPTKVSIINNQNLKTTKLLHKNKRTLSDLGGNSSEHIEFKEQILSQQWISSFLNEYNGSDRYKKFVKIPELSSLDEDYKSICKLVRFNDEKIKELDKKITEYEEDIRTNEYDNSDLLNDINASVDKLINSDVYCKTISLDSTSTEIKDFSKTIITHKLNYEKEKKEIEKKNEIIFKIKADNTIISLSESLGKLKVKESKLVEFKKILNKFEELYKLKNSIENQKIIISEIVKKQANIKLIREVYNRFSVIRNDIGALRIKIKYNNEVRMNKLLTEKKTMDKTKVGTKQLLNTLEKKLDNLKRQNLQIPIDKEKISVLSRDLDKIDTEIHEYHENIKKFKGFSEILNSRKEQFNKLIKMIKKKDFDLIKVNNSFDIRLPHEYHVLCERIVKSSIKFKEIESNKNKIGKKLKELNSYNDEIKSLITSGLEIVNKNKSTKCPVCNAEYESYAILVDKISNNSYLDEDQNALMNQKADNENLLMDVDKDLKKDYIAIENIITYRYNLIEFELKKRNQKLEEERNKLTRLNEKKYDVSKQLNELKSTYPTKDIDEFQKNLIVKIDSNESEIKDTSLKYEEELEGFNSTVRDINCLKDYNKILETNIEEQLELDAYKSVSEWLSENYQNYIQKGSSYNNNKTLVAMKNDHNAMLDLYQKKEINFIEQELELSSKNFKEELKSLEAMEAQIDKYKNDLKENFREQAQEKKEKIETEVSEIKKNISKYKLLLSEILEKKIENKTVSEIQIEFQDNERKINTLLKSNNNILHELNKVDKLKDEIDPFLTITNKKNAVTQLKKKLYIYKNKISKLLQEEKNALKIYLEDRVSKYFYTDLINKIYKQIDPHPDFTKVEFIANFEEDKPALNILVTEVENERSIVPNLYFSTAQVNLLSLSIFLARALKSQKFDCILIDDPIQSLDSINILSTIDLLRSLAVTHDKQIIISTHEENFHNLLKKKIPTKIFGSKFLKLETFGKVIID